MHFIRAFIGSIQAYAFNKSLRENDRNMLQYSIFTVDEINFVY